jgi:hypothetical protein
VVKRFNKLAGELFENAAVAYTLEQYEKCKEKIKDFGPGLYNDLSSPKSCKEGTCTDLFVHGWKSSYTCQARSATISNRERPFASLRRRQKNVGALRQGI